MSEREFEFQPPPHEYVPPDLFPELELSVNGGEPEAGSPYLIRFQPIEEFAAVDERSADPLLGTEDETVIPKGGTAMAYGDGGAGKTTLVVDLAVHLATGTDWLGLEVPHPVKVGLIENEGPRGKFRKKLRRKLAGWEGELVNGRIDVLEEPWAVVTLAEESHRAALAAAIEQAGIELLVAGPVSGIGMAGGGTLDETAAFMALVEDLRRRLERPLAVLLVHHESKAGAVSGAWEGRPDTLAHVQERGNGHTAVKWQKVRWSSELHGKTWKLDWRGGESFEVDETPELTDDDVRDAILTAVREDPGLGARRLEEAVKGRRAESVREIRDALLSEGEIVNQGTANKLKLHLPNGTSEVD